MNNKRQITPHKGGRTIKKSTDVTPEISKMLEYLWRNHKLSLGDIVDQAVKLEYQRCAKSQDDT